MKIFFAADHAGFELKNELIEFVRELGFETEDCGAFEKKPEDDYPEFVRAAALKVSENKECRAVILGGSGQGEAIVANRFKGVRAAVYYGGENEIILRSRTHNDTNVLSLGAAFLDTNAAKAAVQLWLTTPFPGEERHARRIAKIDAL